MQTLKLILLTTLVMQYSMQYAQTRPIALHPDNPHYFIYQDKPLLLVTSAEHYGAVLNLDFAYRPYLEALAADRLNLTRVFTGAYVEPVGAFKIEGNTLAPASGRFVCPWLRSNEPGYANGGNKFDLTQWDPAYFARLHDFMTESLKQNIIVELTLFCPFYEDSQWQLSPMRYTNNVNGLGTTERTDVYTLKPENTLLPVQEALVRKLISELKQYPNLIYEICNEPYFGGVTMEWQHHMASLIASEESGMAQRHLISQNIANGNQKITEPHPDVSVFNFHYATPPVAVAQNYQLNKVIGDNETGFKGNFDSTYRKEGWEFILAGGALYNNLDYSFSAGHEKGTFKYPATQPGGGSAALRSQLRHLRNFVEAFDFITMKPDSTVAASRKVRVLADPGKQYALYYFGKGPVTLQLSLPRGRYIATWTDPLHGTSEEPVRITSKGRVALTSPAFAEDVALSIRRR